MQLLAFLLLLPGSAPAQDPPARPVPGYVQILERAVDLRWLAQPAAAGERAFQFSSYDRRSHAGAGSEDWWANADRGHFLRTEEGPRGTERVLAELEGPGLITRVWSANPQGDLLLYLDGAEEPTWRVGFEELCSGTMDPVREPWAGVRARGWNCHLPIPFAEGMKLTSTGSDFYYHVNVHSLPDGEALQSFRPEWLETYRDDLRRVGSTLLSGEVPYEDIEKLSSNQTAGIAQFRKPVTASLLGSGVVRLLQIRLPQLERWDDPATVLRSLRLQIRAQGDDPEPQVDVPLAAFFGTGPWADENAGYALRFDRSKAEFTCRLPMPYEKGFTAQVSNEGGLRANVIIYVVCEPGPVGTPLRLHAAWKQERDVPTRPRRDYTVLEAVGPGRFVGCSLLVRNPSRVWWGEGDKKFWVDGEGFPSTFGTGTEDYFGYAWCSPEVFHSPFHNQMRCEGPANFGYTLVNRLQTLDSVSFEESFRYDLEVWHWDEEVAVDLTSTAWWYGPLGSGAAMPELPARDDRLVRGRPELEMHEVEGALEAELMEVVAVKGGTVQKQHMSSFEGDWSRESQLWWTGGMPGEFLVVGFPVQDPGTHRLLARFTRAPDYAIVQPFLDGRPVGEPIDLYSPTVTGSEEIDLGVHDFETSSARFTLRITGCNEAAIEKYMVGLDYLRLAPPGAAAEGSGGGGLYGLRAPLLDGGEQDLADWKGRVSLVVNVASACGYTPQYSGLQALHEELSAEGFQVLGFPCNQFGGQEPGSAGEIRAFCEERFGVDFPLFAKVDVKGPRQSPVYRLLTADHEEPSWNFCKYLVGRDGRVLGFFPSKVAPDSSELREAIEAALASG